MSVDQDLLQALQKRGVIVHAPHATVIEDVDADAFERGVEIFPAVTIRGVHSRFGAQTKLGRAGGGYFENVTTGRNVDLYGGYFQDCVFLDGATLRGHAEVRGGTILEEGAEGAHHVGLKMTILLPWVVAGSLINLCDVLMSGGTSRKNHSEVGSALALYNFTPWGDKHASLFGDVPRGVFQREAPIFIGGSTQIVSPVHIGYGSVIAAGCAVRRNVPENRLYGEAPQDLNLPFSAQERGLVGPKIEGALHYLGNIVALQTWYRHVRIPIAKKDDHLQAVYAHAERQLNAQIKERTKRVRQMLESLEPSLEQHLLALEERRDGLSFAQRYRRIDDHRHWLAQREALELHLADIENGAFLKHRTDNDPFAAIVKVAKKQSIACLPTWLRDELSDDLLQPAQRALQAIVKSVANPDLNPSHLGPQEPAP